MIISFVDSLEGLGGQILLGMGAMTAGKMCYGGTIAGGRRPAGQKTCPEGFNSCILLGRLSAFHGL